MNLAASIYRCALCLCSNRASHRKATEGCAVTLNFNTGAARDTRFDTSKPDHRRRTRRGIIARRRAFSRNGLGAGKQQKTGENYEAKCDIQQRWFPDRRPSL